MVVKKKIIQNMLCNRITLYQYILLQGHIFGTQAQDVWDLGPMNAVQ